MNLLKVEIPPIEQLTPLKVKPGTGTFTQIVAVLVDFTKTTTGVIIIASLSGLLFILGCFKCVRFCCCTAAKVLIAFKNFLYEFLRKNSVNQAVAPVTLQKSKVKNRQNRVTNLLNIVEKNLQKRVEQKRTRLWKKWRH